MCIRDRLETEPKSATPAEIDEMVEYAERPVLPDPTKVDMEIEVVTYVKRE